MVRKGVPFRDTHHISGQCVAFSERTGVRMDQMSYTDFRNIDSRFAEDVLLCFNYEHSVEQHSAIGGTAKARVLEQVEILKNILK